jgi:tetratricopeptide (TPR) repeat protein
MTWKPSPEPNRYDRERVASFTPVRQAIMDLHLPALRYRKLNGILNALEMQIEDGGDSPDVNHHLLEALRENIRHQVGEKRGRAALRAIDTFAQKEAKRWEQVRAGTLPPITLMPQERLEDLIGDGYDLLEARQPIAAMNKWLEAWEQVKQMVTPEMRTVDAFDAAYPGMYQSLSNWCSDLEMELHNAGLNDAVYFAHRASYVNEFLAQFPDEGPDCYVSMLRAKGEALWKMGRQAEAEAVYQALIERYPDEGWGYIGWSDQYYTFRSRTPVYEPAEALLLQAFERPTLKDRSDVLERLVGLYEQWSKPEKRARYAAELEKQRQRHSRHRPLVIPPPANQRPGRNDPCWCGSGKKYKQCHLRSDKKATR